MLASIGIDREWFEEDDEGRVVEAVFAAEMGLGDSKDLLAQLDPQILDFLRFEQAVSQDQPFVSKLQAFLTEKNTALQPSADASIPPRQRTALTLVSQVTPEPESSHNMKWLLGQATASAKYIRIEEKAGAAFFVFPDRSILSTVDSGEVHAVPTGSEANILKILVWLVEQGIVGRPGAKG